MKPLSKCLVCGFTGSVYDLLAHRETCKPCPEVLSTSYGMMSSRRCYAGPLGHKGPHTQ